VSATSATSAGVVSVGGAVSEVPLSTGDEAASKNCDGRSIVQAESALAATSATSQERPFAAARSSRRFPGVRYF
jgi:hypothetical protein